MAWIWGKVSRGIICVTVRYSSFHRQICQKVSPSPLSIPFKSRGLLLFHSVKSCFAGNKTKQNKNMFYSYHCFVLQIHLEANFIYCHLSSSPICGFLMVTQRQDNRSFVGSLSQQRHFAAQHPDASSSHPSHPLLTPLVHSQCSWLP